MSQNFSMRADADGEVHEQQSWSAPAFLAQLFFGKPLDKKHGAGLPDAPSPAMIGTLDRSAAVIPAAIGSVVPASGDHQENFLGESKDNEKHVEEAAQEDHPDANEKMFIGPTSTRSAVISDDAMVEEAAVPVHAVLAAAITSSTIVEESQPSPTPAAFAMMEEADVPVHAILAAAITSSTIVEEELQPSPTPAAFANFATPAFAFPAARGSESIVMSPLSGMPRKALCVLNMVPVSGRDTDTINKHNGKSEVVFVVDNRVQVFKHPGRAMDTPSTPHFPQGVGFTTVTGPADTVPVGRRAGAGAGTAGGRAGYTPVPGFNSPPGMSSQRSVSGKRRMSQTPSNTSHSGLCPLLDPSGSGSGSISASEAVRCVPAPWSSGELCALQRGWGMYGGHVDLECVCEALQHGGEGEGEGGTTLLSSLSLQPPLHSSLLGILANILSHYGTGVDCEWEGMSHGGSNRAGLSFHSSRTPVAMAEQLLRLHLQSRPPAMPPLSSLPVSAPRTHTGVRGGISAMKSPLVGLLTSSPAPSPAPPSAMSLSGLRRYMDMDTHKVRWAGSPVAMDMDTGSSGQELGEARGGQQAIASPEHGPVPVEHVEGQGGGQGGGEGEGQNEFEEFLDRLTSSVGQDSTCPSLAVGKAKMPSLMARLADMDRARRLRTCAATALTVTAHEPAPPPPSPTPSPIEAVLAGGGPGGVGAGCGCACPRAPPLHAPGHGFCLMPVWIGGPPHPPFTHTAQGQAGTAFAHPVMRHPCQWQSMHIGTGGGGEVPPAIPVHVRLVDVRGGGQEKEGGPPTSFTYPSLPITMPLAALCARLSSDFWPPPVLPRVAGLFGWAFQHEEEAEAGTGSKRKRQSSPALRDRLDSTLTLEEASRGRGGEGVSVLRLCAKLVPLI